jgi:hypothetical protein
MTESHSASVMLTIIRSRRVPALLISTSELAVGRDGRLIDHRLGLVQVADVGAVGHRVATGRLDLGHHIMSRAPN